jgi:hypothetical protein
VPIVLAALRELRARRPGLDLRLYGQAEMPRVDFPVTNLGVLSGPELARLYAQATVGMCLSLTNYALVPQEMLACGLPCVEARMPSVVAAYGTDGPVALADPRPFALAGTLERLLDDPAERARRPRRARGSSPGARGTPPPTASRPGCARRSPARGPDAVSLLPRRREARPEAPPPPRPVPLPPALGDLLRAGPVPPGMPEAPDDVVLVLPEPAGRRAREVAVPLAAALGARVVADEADADGVGTAVAVGWRAVAAVLRAHDCGTRALLAVDHEPDLVAPASSEARWAVDAYRRGLPAVAAGPWLAQTLASATAPTRRRSCRGSTTPCSRRGPSCAARTSSCSSPARGRRCPSPSSPWPGSCAAGPSSRSRSSARPVRSTSRSAPHVGAVPAAERAEVFNSATVALVPSLSVPPAVAGELMACAAPLVLPDTPAASDLGPAPLLAPHDPGEVADALERLVDDPEDRSDRVRAGLAAAAGWTWEQAAADVSAALGRAR